MLYQKQGIHYIYIYIYIYTHTHNMVISRDQNAGRIDSVRTDNSTFERVEEFKYFGTTLTNQNSIPEEIKSRLMPGNGCYHSGQKLLSYQVAIQKFKD